MGQHYAVPPSMQQNVGTDTQPGAAADEAVTVDVHVAEPGGPSVASSPRAPAKNHVLQCIAHNVHWLTFVPLIIISSLQDVHILLAAILGTSICVVVLAAGFFLQCGGYTKVGASVVFAAAVLGCWCGPRTRDQPCSRTWI